MDLPMTRLRCAILDDYYDTALSLADWPRLGDKVDVTAFTHPFASEDAATSALADFDVVCAMRERTPFPRALIERLPNLKLLITTGGRNRGIDLEACAERGITVCGTPSFAHPTVDLTWGLILSLMRRIPEQEAALRQGSWQVKLGNTLEGKTLGCVGLGNLGSRVAKVGAAFGMKVIAWSQNLTPEKAAAAGAVAVPKEQLLAEADVVTLHLILSDRSRGIIGAGDLARMKPSSFIVNTSRGPLIDQAALIEALQEKRIAGAGIDFYAREPLPADHPLLAAPNTVLTP